MPLKLVHRPKSPYWIMRGTVRGISIEESTGTTNKAVAEEIRTKREAEILTESVYGKSITVTFAHAVADYLEHGSGAKRFMQPVLDHFGMTLLRDIDQHAIDTAAKKLFPKGGSATRNRQAYTPISSVLHHAAKKGWCSDPVIARPEQPKGKVRWIKADEADKLIDACAGHLRPLVVFMLYTGARTGEALWLDWSNVDLGMRQVTFPKTKNGEPRSVPLHPRVVEELAKLGHRTGDVFLTNRGKPYSRPKPDDDADTSAGSRISSGFRGACNRAGITNFTPHCCRHTWATWHHQKNRDLPKLQELGGWRSIEMVLRYAHTNVEQHADSINALPWGKIGEQQTKKTGTDE